MHGFLYLGLQNGETDEVWEFPEGVRRSSMAEKMVYLQFAIKESSGKSVYAQADAEAAETVTNSLEEQIDRRVKRKWIKDIPPTINKMIAVARGAS